MVLKGSSKRRNSRHFARCPVEAAAGRPIAAPENSDGYTEEGADGKPETLNSGADA